MNDHPRLHHRYTRSSTGKTYTVKAINGDEVVLGHGGPGRNLIVELEEFDPASPDYDFEYEGETEEKPAMQQAFALPPKAPQKPAPTLALPPRIELDDEPGDDTRTGFVTLDVPLQLRPPPPAAVSPPAAPRQPPEGFSGPDWYPYPGRQYKCRGGKTWTVVQTSSGRFPEVWFKEHMAIRNQPHSLSKWGESIHLFDPDNKNNYYKALDLPWKRYPHFAEDVQAGLKKLISA